MTGYYKACAFLEDVEDNALVPDGFETAVIGVVELKSVGYVMVLSTRKCLDILIERSGMDEEEALDYFHYNVKGSYLGDKTPLFLEDLSMPEKEKKDE